MASKEELIQELSDAIISCKKDRVLEAVDKAKEAGVTAIVEPGGSVRDNEVIEAANEHDIALLFTGTRHFRH